MIGAIIFALALHYRKEIMSTRLAQGNYSLGITFWLYGALFTPILASGLIFYIQSKSQSFDSILDVLSAFSAVSAAVVILAMHCLMVAISIWKSANNYKGFFLFRWWAKNFIVGIPVAIAIVFYFPGPFVLGGTLYWLANKYKRNSSIV